MNNAHPEVDIKNTTKINLKNLTESLSVLIIFFDLFNNNLFVFIEELFKLGSLIFPVNIPYPNLAIPIEKNIIKIIIPLEGSISTLINKNAKRQALPIKKINDPINLENYVVKNIKDRKSHIYINKKQIRNSNKQAFNIVYKKKLSLINEH